MSFRVHIPFSLSGFVWGGLFTAAIILLFDWMNGGNVSPNAAAIGAMCSLFAYWRLLDIMKEEKAITVVDEDDE